MKKKVLICCAIAMLTQLTNISAQTFDVGSLPGEANVSPSGAFTYAIPIDLPPGRSGMEPALSLVYDNQSPTNILGVGWSLTGFSSIGRVNPTLYYNDEVDNVDFDDDQLMIDGNKIIQTRVEDGNIIYRTELDDFSKIIYYSSGTYGDYFRVYTKNGLIKEYGNSSDSRQYYAGCSTSDDSPLFWHLNKVVDRQNNSVRYFYQQSPESGSLLPIRIEYTHYEEQSPGDFSYAVVFRYSPLPDSATKQTFYFEREGEVYKNINFKRLDRIAVYVKNDINKKIKTYDLTYHSYTSMAGEYFLKSVLLTNHDPVSGKSASLNPTKFDWNFYKPQRAKHSIDFKGFISDPFFDQHHYVLSSLDIDGDGKKEVVDYKEEYNEIEGYPTRIVTVYTFGPRDTVSITENITSRVKSLSSADFDNDGKDELIVVLADTIQIYSFQQAGNKWYAEQQLVLNKPGAYLKAYSGDYSGDGLIDLLVVDEIAGEAELNLGTGNEPDYFHTTTYIFDDFNAGDQLEEINAVADFNGDGKTDIALEKRTNIADPAGEITAINYLLEIHSFTGSDFEMLSGNLSFVNDSAVTKEDHIFYVDLNGDGRCDIHHQIKPMYGQYGYESNTSYHSFGKGFIKNPETTTLHKENSPSLYLNDMNNDGRADWVYIEPGIDPEGYIGQFILTKTYFAHPNGLSNLPVIQKTYITNGYNYAGAIAGLTMCDLNGNGINDIAISFLKEVGDEPSPRPYEYQLYALSDTVKVASNVITSVTNGMGVQHTVHYQSSQKSFRNFHDLNYPIAPYKAISWNVDEIYICDEQMNKLNHFKYEFSTPMVMLTGKGFMGYRSTEVTSFDSYTRTIHHYKTYVEEKDGKEYGFVQYPEHTIVETIDDQPVKLKEAYQEIKLKYTVNGSNLIQLPVATVSIEKLWDNDDQHSFIKTTKSIQKIEDIDRFGNSLERSLLVDEGQPQSDNEFNYKIVTTNTYAAYIDETNWLIGRPESVTRTQKKRGEKDDILTTQFQYLEHSMLIRQKSVTPNNNDSLKYFLEFEYDGFGNLTRQTIDPGKFQFNGNAFEKRVTEYSYNYDANHLGRFMESSRQSLGEVTFQTSYAYDVNTGAAVQITNPDLHESDFDYDITGRLNTITDDFGIVNHKYLLWNNHHPYEPTHYQAAYYHQNYLEGAQDHGRHIESFSFYDKFGRLLRKVSMGSDNQPICVDYEYDSKGRLWRFSEPFYLGEEATLHTMYNYDSLGRIIRTWYARGSVINQYYHGRSTSAEDLATFVTSTKVINALGNVQSITDPTGSINYDYFSSGKVKTIDALGAVTAITYDDAGRQKSIDEPNTGKQTYVYNPFGELLQQTDSRGNIYEMTYDNFGRLLEKKLVNSGESTLYIYHDEMPTKEKKGHGFGMLEQMLGANGYNYHYFYDEFNRMDMQLEIHPDIDHGTIEFAGRYAYENELGRLEKYTFPTGFEIAYAYSPNGMLKSVSDAENKNMLWEIQSTNPLGQITEFCLGNGLTTHKVFDKFGNPSIIETGDVQHLGFKFNRLTGNLESRSDNIRGLEEHFSYDYLLKSRLTSWKVEGQQHYFSSFANNGNLVFKSDVTNLYKKEGIQGEYIYGANAGPHAVTGITNPTGEYENIGYMPEFVSYTAFNKLANLKQLDKGVVKELDFTYGPDEARKVTKYYDTPEERKRTLIQTKHFVMNNFEVEIDRFGKERKLHYLHAGDGLFAIYVEEEKNRNMFYVHKDYLGSYYCITDEDGKIAEYNGEEQVYSFDPWGRRRNAESWTFDDVPDDFLFDRGFTGHEHLDNFQLINMNGRVYDPWLGRFMSADPIVQAPGYSQNFNRYAYAFNNPLKYVDRSGYSNGPPHDFNGRGADRGFVGTPFSVLGRGQISFSFSTNFSNSGFVLATRETITEFVGIDDFGEAIYKHKQVLVLKDRYGNSLVSLIKLNKKSVENQEYLGTVHYLVTKGKIIIIGVDTPDGESWFNKQVLKGGEQLVSVILIGETSVDEWYENIETGIKAENGYSILIDKSKLNHSQAKQRLREEIKFWNLHGSVSNVLLTSVGTLSSIALYFTSFAATAAISSIIGGSSITYGSMVNAIENNYSNTLYHYMNDSTNKGLYIISHQITYNRSESPSTVGVDYFYNFKGEYLGSISY